MWFTETAWPPAILLAVAAAVCAWFGLRRGRRSILVAGLLLAVLIPIAFVVERVVVTPAEEIEQRIFAIREAVVADDVDATLKFISSRALAERGAIRIGMRFGRVQPDVDITDLNVSVTANSSGVSYFRANGTFVLESPIASGERRIATYWRLMWRREAGQWKVHGIDRLHPVTGELIPMFDAR